MNDGGLTMEGRKKVLLVCGAGMSSGIISKNAKKYAKKERLNIDFEARSTSEVSPYLSSIDLLMIGPHYALELDKFKKMATPYDVPVVTIPRKTYAMMDGETISKIALDNFN